MVLVTYFHNGSIYGPFGEELAKSEVNAQKRPLRAPKACGRISSPFGALSLGWGLTTHRPQNSSFLGVHIQNSIR